MERVTRRKEDKGNIVKSCSYFNTRPEVHNTLTPYAMKFRKSCMKANVKEIGEMYGDRGEDKR